MRIDSDRFGPIEVPEEELIRFPAGIIGFPKEQAFVLIRHGESSIVAWLQSAGTAGLAFPVVSAHGLAPEYPDVDVVPLASRAGLGESAEDLAVLAVLSATRGVPATVNLLAPIVVNASTRLGAQLFLEGSRFTTRELFMIPKQEAEAAPAERRGQEGKARTPSSRIDFGAAAAAAAAQ